jgi:hypothetical protein
LIGASPVLVTDPETSCGQVHWPPCSGDVTEILWMPLPAAASARQMLGKKYIGRGLPSDAAAQRRLAQLDRRPIQRARRTAALTRLPLLAVAAVHARGMPAEPALARCRRGGLSWLRDAGPAGLARHIDDTDQPAALSHDVCGRR